MNWSKAIRQTHRWVSIIFVMIILAIFATLSLGSEPAAWVYYLPLVPLAFLVLTGLYMFVLPYAAKRGGRGASG